MNKTKHTPHLICPSCGSHVMTCPLHIAGADLLAVCEAICAAVGHGDGALDARVTRSLAGKARAALAMAKGETK